MSVSEVLPEPVASGGNRWNQAYGMALGNAGMYLLLSLLCDWIGPFSVEVQSSICLLFFAGSVAALFLMVRAGLEMGAISVFILASGVFFGGGAAAIALGGEPNFQTFFSPEDQVALFAKANIINALCTMVVLLAAGPWSHPVSEEAQGVDGIAKAISVLLPYRTLVLLAGPVICVVILSVSFPLPSNLLFRTPVYLLTSLVIISIILGAAQWDKLRWHEMVIVASTTALLSFNGLMQSSKGSTLMPFGAFALGLMLERKSRKLLAAIIAFIVIVYPTFVAPICMGSRIHPAYSETNTLVERVAVVGGVIELATSAFGQATSVGTDELLQRFGFLQVQAFLIFRHDNGQPGDTLEQAWAAAIPRIFWPGKPDVTYVGSYVDTIYNNQQRTSALGPSFVAEAYWNWGWLGVVLVSILVGLEVGWLTREWNRFRAYGFRHAGMLIFSLFALMPYFSIEAAIAGSYIGGFLTSFIMITATNFVLRAVIPEQATPLTSVASGEPA